MTDLSPLGTMLGDARIVAFSEAEHFAAEPLALRNRLFKYLVEQYGFKAIAIESGIVEGRVLDDYVLGGDRDLSDTLALGLGWQFDWLPQNAELLRWMRRYNSTRSTDEKIHIFGIDVPGSPGNIHVTQGPEVALESALRYLGKVDPAAAAEYGNRVRPYLSRLKAGYAMIRQPDRDSLSGAITDLISLIEQHQFPYAARSSAEEYEWALRGAIGARQVDSWMRQIPVGWNWEAGSPPSLGWAAVLRDRDMADNLDWILRQLSPKDRVLVFAALAHLAAAPIQHAQGPPFISLGVHLKHRYRNQLLTIGTLFGGGAIAGCGTTPRIVLANAPPLTLNGLMGQLGVPLFVLDFRTAPPPVASWLSDVREIWGGDIERVRISDAMDVLVFIRSLSPACKRLQ